MQSNNRNQKLYNFYEKYLIQILFVISIIVSTFLMFNVYPKIKINSDKQEIKKILDNNHLFPDIKQKKQKLAIEYIKSFPLYIKLLENYKKNLNKKIDKIQKNINDLKTVTNVNINANVVINNYKNRMNKLKTTINDIDKLIGILQEKYKIYFILLKNNVNLTQSNIYKINNLYNNINKFIYDNLIKPNKNLTKKQILQNKFLEIIWKTENENANNPEKLLQYPVKFKSSFSLIMMFIPLVLFNVIWIAIIIHIISSIFTNLKKFIKIKPSKKIKIT